MSRKFKKVLSTANGRKRAASMLATGATEREVAEELGCTPGAVNQFKQRCRELIEVEKNRFLASVPYAVDVASQLIRDYSDPVSRESMGRQLSGHAHAHIMEVLRLAGIYPSSRRRPAMIENLNVNHVGKSVDVSGIEKEKAFEHVMALLREV
jgi:hypothetical protein